MSGCILYTFCVDKRSLPKFEKTLLKDETLVWCICLVASKECMLFEGLWGLSVIFDLFKLYLLLWVKTVAWLL